MTEQILSPDAARSRLERAGIFELLHPFDPRFVGSIPLDVHGPGADADIACGGLELTAFRSKLERLSHHTGFSVTDNVHAGEASIIARMVIEGLPVEIYGRTRPVETHESYVHWLAEHRLLTIAGDDLRKDVRAAKLSGLKTEPAFAQCLKLGDDPFVEILKLAAPSDDSLRILLRQAGYEPQS